MSAGNILLDDLGAGVETAMKSVDFFDDVVGGNLANTNQAIFYWPKKRDGTVGALGQCRIVPEDYVRDRNLPQSKFGEFSFLVTFDFNDTEARDTMSVTALQALQRIFDSGNGLALLNTHFVDNGVVDGDGNQNRLGKGGTVELEPDPLIPIDDQTRSIKSVAYRLTVGVWHRDNLR